MSAPFRFDAKNVFLTYPNSGSLTKEQLRDFLVDKLGARYYHIGLESHSDGRPHLHAYAGWDGRHRARGADHFDVLGQHPNITIPRNTRDVRNYIAKDGDVLSNCSEADFGDGERVAHKWGALLQAPNKRAFMDGAQELDPRAFVLQHERLEYFCDKRYGREADTYVGRERREFVEPELLARWVLESWEVTGPGGPQSPPSRLLIISSHAYWLFFF